MLNIEAEGSKGKGEVLLKRPSGQTEKKEKLRFDGDEKIQVLYIQKDIIK